MSKTVKTVAFVLVVDDEPYVREGIRITLESAGYQVVTADDGFEALNILQSQPVDLILADIAMPRMNGYQLYLRVRENRQWLAIPFVFLTGRAMDSDVRYGKELGIDDYLAKPIDPEDLLAVVRGKVRRALQLERLVAQPAPPSAPAPRALIIGRLRIVPDEHRAWLDEEPLDLSPKEFALLEYMAQRVNQLVSPEEAVQVTHELDTDRTDASNLLRPLIRSLRRKLGYTVGETGCIETVRGLGYRLMPPDD